MTKVEALNRAKEDSKFLENYLEWNSDKEVVIVAVQYNQWTLEYA